MSITKQDQQQLRVWKIDPDIKPVFTSAEMEALNTQLRADLAATESELAACKQMLATSRQANAGLNTLVGTLMREKKQKEGERRWALAAGWVAATLLIVDAIVRAM